ncbi:MAG TPA: LLM class flavin-dependent oxidoreductase [Gemmatimonadales bacterium]|nr:LLM class flavin-dependent oxidoreductase [Gemmatimonadales bacterium]
MPRPLKVGIQLPEVEREVRWPELRDMARVAEQVGFDSLWVGDHLLFRDPGLPPRGPWEAWSTLAALAAVTEHVELGPLVASVSFHSPAMLAKKAATLDEISGGRLILGLGAGWNEPEYRAFGFPFDHRFERFEEAFTIIRALLRGEEVTVAGRYHQVEGCVLRPAPRRPGGPPVMIGTTGRRMLHLAAQHADAWNAWFTWYGNRPEGIPVLRGNVDAACAAVGRDPATLARTVAALIQIQGKEVAIRGGKQERVPPLRGLVEELAGDLRAFAAEGISHVQLVVDPITIDSIERLAPVIQALDR